MQAAFLTEVGHLEVRETSDPRPPGPREVLVRVATVGVCGSDLHYYRTGRIGAQAVEFPWIPGHECAGTVVEAGAQAERRRPGQRVAIDPLLPCGRCDQCRAGRKHTCRSQKFLGSPGQAPGALTEYLVLPEECCFPIPGAMTLVEAAVVEPFSIALYAQRMAGLGAGSKIAVLGAGPIGLCVLLACRAAAHVTGYVTDLLDERLAVARACGADWTGNPRGVNIVAALTRTEPQGMDFVFECAGEQETLDQALELLKPGGTLLILGIPEADRVSFNIDLLRRKELEIRNVRRQNQCVAPAIDLAARGAVNLRTLVTHHFTLSQTAAAFETVANYRDGAVKAIIHISEDS